MTSLYLDTNIGCIENRVNGWTAEDEGRVTLVSLIKKLFA